jgi:hypothetical protein
MSNEALQEVSNDQFEAEFAAMEAADAQMPVEEAPVEEAVQETVAEEVVEAPAEAPVEEVAQPANDTVPLATFLETKNDLKSTKQQIAELQEKLDALANPPEPEVSIDEDPVGYLEKQSKMTQERIDQLGEEMRQATQTQQASNMQTYVSTAEQQFSAQNPDYFDSVAHLQQARVEHYKIMGANEQQAFQAVNNELIGVTQTAIQNGKNPAQVVYELSKSTGFNKPAAERQGDKTLKALAKAQDSSGTLSSVPGQTGDDRENVMSANSLNDAEFDKKFLGDDAAFEALFR